MTDQIYTAPYVEARFREAGAVVRAYPDREIGWLRRCERATWPQVKPTGWQEAYGRHEVRRAMVWPSTHQHDRADEALGWLLWLDPVDRTIVLAKACGYGSTTIARKMGIERTTIWRRNRRAINRVVRRLNSLATNATAMVA